MNITEEQREEINEAVGPSQSTQLFQIKGNSSERSSRTPLISTCIQFGLFDLDKDQRIDYHEF
jgi:hypothetical protein